MSSTSSTASASRASTRPGSQASQRSQGSRRSSRAGTPAKQPQRNAKPTTPREIELAERIDFLRAQVRRKDREIARHKSERELTERSLKGQAERMRDALFKKEAAQEQAKREKWGRMECEKSVGGLRNKRERERSERLQDVITLHELHAELAHVKKEKQAVHLGIYRTQAEVKHARRDAALRHPGRARHAGAIH